MRYAVVSDIHANLAAWNTVLADASLHRVDAVICLGDTVGYGPQPAEVLRSVHSRCVAMLLGNHDAAVCGRISLDAFNDRARRGAEWTSRRLGSAARSLFSSLPLTLVGGGARFSHGSPADPAAFDYVDTSESAAAAFAAVPEQILFCGHTHIPALFVMGGSGVARKTEPRDFELEDGKRYLVNVGSVGSPRGGDPRASYVVYDTDTRSVYFHRVSFDLAAFRAAVAAASSGTDPLSPGDVPFFAASDSGVAPVREETDFSPAPGVRAETSSAPIEAQLEALSRKATRRLRFSAILASIGAAAAIAGGIVGALALRGPGVSYPDFPVPPVAISETGGPDGNLLPVFAPKTVDGEFLCLPYRVDLGNRRHQTVGADEMWHIVLASTDSVRPARICAPPVECAAGQKFEAFARVRFSPDFRGSFELVATLEKEDGKTETLFTRSFTSSSTGIADSALPTTIRALKHSEGWLLARGTSRDALPAGTSTVRIEVGGNFTGTAAIGAIAARRR